ncbi:AraC family transcriptional regulator [Tepidamorphus gemmatus]|uniref:AraC family transcriptional regulator n=1 Tax=Tepidamorphus gemmatus TaxID=747076 RepID=A0A4R3MG40_9HYPH|nr:helix-turn-helix domain-containing protein [Tepidamorphus gemmatus]TCT12705.1 AraC family transcriptional regulator [Tepidamorphus gemmatus]
MPTSAAIPQFHLYGEHADDHVFDFVHIETIASRSWRHGWQIAPHSHRHLGQILFIAAGRGEMTFEESLLPFAAPVLIFVPPLAVHGFRFEAGTRGHVLSYSRDVVGATPAAGESLAGQLAEGHRRILVPFGPQDDLSRLTDLFDLLAEEHELGRDGYRLAMRACLTLLVIEAGRVAASRLRHDSVTLRRSDTTVERLLNLVESEFRRTRRLADYAEALGLTADRLNDHCKRVAGVTAGHLVRQRVVTEAKRQLMFTDQSVSEIAYDLGFNDPTHFTRFFRRYTGITPQAFREGRPRPRGREMAGQPGSRR